MLSGRAVIVVEHRPGDSRSIGRRGSRVATNRCRSQARDCRYANRYCVALRGVTALVYARKRA